VTLEVVERGVAYEVTVLVVLKGAVGPAGAVKRVILHGDDVHNREGEVPEGFPGVFIPVGATKQPQTGKQEESGDLVVNPVIRTKPVVT
jgi:hypothetical protein